MAEERNERAAAVRGLMGRCPHCGKGRLFRGYLTIVQECESCGEPLGLYRAADGPAFFTMTIMLLLLIPMIGLAWGLYRPDPVTLLVSVGLATTVLTLVILRLVKGAFVGYLWAKHEQDRGA
ncbi:DUF983 domain-containing protein [Paracoccus versutus]|uniref:Uncharacterized protein (DUF983 family) n=2 Tax=Paracoccus versutus TaxID=34007 RepID=A0A3D9XGQ4_PARVE|nr:MULTISPECIES: DUF983 domain-containing protein [Paracoccus]REF69686.1 uncharacterized protein (DUF983 family) [Paracoccus versutus]WGR57947.1 DUF983 domain-containing protein [Paracoccus versutus]